MTKNVVDTLTVDFDRSESAALRLLARHEGVEPPEFVRQLVRAAIGFAESLGRAELIRSQLEPESK